MWFLFLLFSFPFNSFSQEASAEFITEFKPAKLKSGEQARDGIKNLFFSNQKLYVTNIWSGLQILDVSNVHTPQEVGVYVTESRSQNCFIVDNKAYLSSELLGVTILDISNPAEIRQIGQIKTEGDANYVVVDGYFAYVAEETKGVNIYDIANPATPHLRGTYDTPGWAWGLQIVGKTLYVADKNGGLIILDVSNPASPQKLGAYSDMRNAKTVHVENNIAYVSNGADGLWIFDVLSPAFPKLLSKIDVDGYVYHSYKAGNSVFISNETKRRMDIVNVTNPSKPVKEGQYDTNSKVYASWKDNVNVFIAADTRTIIVRHNHPPTITPLADMTVDEQELLMFSTEAFDQDGDEIFYTIENKPKTASFDSSSGVFTWTPTYDESGIYPNIKVSVVEKTDSRLSKSTTFKITVNHVNRAPSLPDVRDTLIAENSRITFTVQEGSDPDVEDRGKLKYYVENLPEGAGFNETARLFSWVPGFEQSGVYTIDFVVEDPGGLLMRDGATITVTHVDRKPTLVEVGDQTVDENSLLAFTLDGSDPDEEDQQLLNYKAENLPEGASFDAASKEFNWTPTYDQSGQYSNILFIFTAGDLSDSSRINITVNHVNRPPVLNDIAIQSTNENDSLTFTISGNDPDVEDSGKLQYEAQNLPEGAQFNSQTQTFSWLPTFEQSAVYENITFIIKDPGGLSDSKSTGINVKHVNRKPELQEITAKVIDENVLLTFDLQGSDPDKEDQDKLVYSADGLPQGAKLEGITFNWTPTFDQSGSYTVDFTITDGILTDTKSALITVNHVNRNPELAEITEQKVNENELLEFPVVGSDPDVEDAGKFILSANDLPQGAIFDAQSGSFSWTPGFDQAAEYTVTFKNTDPQGLTAEKQVKISVTHVNRTPVFSVQDPQLVNENELLSFSIKPASDPDVEDEGKLQYSAANLPEGATFDEQALTFNWTPGYDQSGRYTITLTVKDGEFSVDQPVDLTVNHVNREPSIEAISTQTTDENKEVLIQLNVSDPDQEDTDNVTTTVSNLPEGAVFDAAANTIRWTPTYKQAGTYSGITVTASDQAGLSVQANFDIIVNNVNLPPQINAISSQTVDENSTLSVNISASDPDVEDEGKVVLSVQNLPDGATFDAATGTFAWTPSFDQSGDFSLKAVATDAEGLQSETDLNITVNNINRPPQIKEIEAQTVNENSMVTIPVEVSDPDNQDQDKLKISAGGLPAGATLNESAKSISWTPDYEQSGSYTVNLTVADPEGLNASTSFDITVNHINRAPLFTSVGNQSVDEDNNFSLTLAVNDPDKEDANDVSVTLENLPEGATFEAQSKTLSWTPTYYQKGSYTVKAVAKDPAGMSTETSFTITVNNVNRDPQINGPSTGETEAGSELSLNYSASDADEDDTLTFSVDGAPSGVSINASGNLTWTPGAEQAGNHTFNVVVSDGSSQARITLSVTVTGQPQAQPQPATPEGN